MKLKPVVASLFVLGLVSGSALAAGNQAIIQQSIVDQNAVISPVCADNWFNRISISGIGTIQATWADKDPAGTFWPTNHSTDLYVNNFNVIANAVLNSWTKATVNLAYIGFPTYTFLPSIYRSNFTTPPGALNINIEWAAERHTSNVIHADEAYVTFANFCKTPFYFKVGKTYVPFGTYSDPYNFVLTPMTQQLAQVNQTAAILGFATDMGLYGNVYAFRGNSQAPMDDSGMIRNFGAELGYYGSLSSFDARDAHYNINVGIIRAIQDGDFWTKNTLMRDLFHYSHPVAGFAAHADLSWKQFDFFANYVVALKNIQIIPDVPKWLSDLGILTQADVDTFVDKYFTDNRKLWAADVNADYAFQTWCHDSKIGLSWQFGGNGDFMAKTLHVFYPKYRLQADYKVNLIKNVDFDLVYAYSRSFDYSINGMGFDSIPPFIIGNTTVNIKTGLPNGTESSNVVLGKLSIQF